MTETLIEVEKLVKKYGNKKVVNGISFSVKRGEIFGILGPNGAGKTSTLEMIETMKKIDGGTAYIDGVNVAKHPAKIKTIIGIQPQSAAFEERTTLVEHIRFFASTYNKKVNPMTFLKSVDLADKANSYPENLSGGQRQRFSLAIALVHDPQVFFLDEPTTGLDPQARMHLWDMIKEIRDRGITVVLTTHYMEEAELLCDRVAIMDNGKILTVDSPSNLVKKIIKQGFKKPHYVAQANLEDVFIKMTGKALRV